VRHFVEHLIERHATAVGDLLPVALGGARPVPQAQARHFEPKTGSDSGHHNNLAL